MLSYESKDETREGAVREPSTTHIPCPLSRLRWVKGVGDSEQWPHQHVGLRGQVTGVSVGVGSGGVSVGVGVSVGGTLVGEGSGVWVAVGYGSMVDVAVGVGDAPGAVVEVAVGNGAPDDWTLVTVSSAIAFAPD